MNYKIVNNSVVEIKTNHVIVTSDDKDLLRKTKRRLNGGQGFCGHTPAFFLNGLQT